MGDTMEAKKIQYLTQEEFDALPATPPALKGLRWKAECASGSYLMVVREGGESNELGRIEVVSAEMRVRFAVEDERAKAKQKAPPGPEFEAFAAMAPALAAELMREFIERKNLNERAQIRLKVKALQDFFSADTGYPPVPAISADQQYRRGGFAQQAGRPYLGVGAVPGFRVAGEAAQLEAAVAEAVGEEEVAEGVRPADVVPAPGAPVAPVMGA
jgi:hypothetical protein